MTTQLPWPAAALLGSTWQGIRTVLARCVREQREHGLPGTLMLAGAPGLGREALAVELAATLVCRAGGEPGCGCSSCERIRRGIHPDVVVVTVEAGKSDITVAQAHEVVGTLAHHPYEGVRRVFILASCHTPPLHADAASALLKSLEEPPPLVTFLLLASNPARVLPTVVSRAVQIRVPPPERHELLPALAMIGACSEEQAAALLDALGGNAALAGQVAAFATADDVARIAGLVGEALSGDAAAVVEAARTVESALREAGEDPRRAALAHELLPAILVRLASAAGAGTPETAVELAATLLAAERRRLALRLDAESVVAGVFAQSAVSRRLGLPEAENG